MMKNTKKGFTLIELLVVIAIIGILASVVLASLSTARNKARDAAIKSQLSALRTQAEIYYDSNGSYGATASDCTTGTNLWDDTQAAALITRIDSDNGSGAISCDNTGTAWAAQSALIGATGVYCVDSRGTAVQNATAFTITDQECD